MKKGYKVLIIIISLISILSFLFGIYVSPMELYMKLFSVSMLGLMSIAILLIDSEVSK